MASIEPRRLAALPGTAGEDYPHGGLPAMTGDERILPGWGQAVPAAGTGGPRYWRQLQRRGLGWGDGPGL